MIARYTDSSQRVYLTDALGSVIAQTREDQSIQNWYGYSPYGQAVSATDDEGNAVEYTGRENDETGLYYYRARYYDPVLKRFVSEDPIGLLGAFNVYAYVDENPISLVDPTGETPPVIVPQVAVGTSAFFFGKAIAEGVGDMIEIGLQAAFVAERNEQKATIAKACANDVPGACDAARQMEKQIVTEEIGDVSKKGADVIKDVIDYRKKAKDLFDPKKRKRRN
jgi:RHS repeat-associated protein